MATSSAINNEPVSGASAVDMKFEVIVIPVADVDRSKAFYTKLGWRLDADFSFDNGFRVVQFTPPGSGCSVQFGTKITTAAPGSAQGLYLIVSHVEAARKELVARGVEVSEVFHTLKPGAQFRPDSDGRASGPDPGHRSYFSFATFSDPDGNSWLLQEITPRLPDTGRLSRTYLAKPLIPLYESPTTRPKRANATLRGTRPSSQCRPDPASDLRISPTSAQRTPSDSRPSIF
jgi:catechol 2,3-dioxygenase-like lactoylglutathione lyase family enzyme